MNKIIKETLVKEIAESIMTDGYGRKATRLILEFDGKTDNTGRNQISVESQIRKHLESRPLAEEKLTKKDMQEAFLEGYRNNTRRIMSGENLIKLFNNWYYDEYEQPEFYEKLKQHINQ